MSNYLKRLVFIVLMGSICMLGYSQDRTDEVIAVGIIGLDTSHAPSFTNILNNGEDEAFANVEVVAAYPHGSRVIESSYSRIPEYTEAVTELGVDIVDSIAELLERVDAVLLLTNDGQERVQQAEPVMEAGLPLYVGKPLAASLEDALRLFELVDEHDAPLFTTSAVRYASHVSEARVGTLVGDLIGASTYSPAYIQEHHPDLYWYGIHGVEMLFAAMGTGCENVWRVNSEDADVVVGQWADGRIGSYRGIREGAAAYAGTAFGSEGIEELGPFQGNEPLLREIVSFFETGISPVDREETLEVFAFMSAADRSKERGGEPVSLQSVLQDARSHLHSSTK